MPTKPADLVVPAPTTPPPLLCDNPSHTPYGCAGKGSCHYHCTNSWSRRTRAHGSPASTQRRTLPAPSLALTPLALPPSRLALPPSRSPHIIPSFPRAYTLVAPAALQQSRHDTELNAFDLSQAGHCAPLTTSPCVVAAYRRARAPGRDPLYLASLEERQ